MFEQDYYSFIQGLCAREGITHFHNLSQGSVWTFIDRTETNTVPILKYNKLLFNYSALGQSHSAFAYQLHWQDQIGTTSVTTRDNYFIKPYYDQEQVAVTTDKNTENIYPKYVFPGEHKTSAVGKAFTQHRLDATRVRSSLGTIKSNCIYMSAGEFFSLHNHPSGQFNNTPYLILNCTHKGYQPQALKEHCGVDVNQPMNSDDPLTAKVAIYHNHLEVIDKKRRYKPLLNEQKYPTPKAVDQMARVVGPPGETVFTDEYGRIQIAFLWDRAHTHTCFVRVAQSWGSAGYGISAFPRIGDEVIVSYINGCYNQPIITNRLHNEARRHPEELPHNNSRTTIKTKSINGDINGHNMLYFEDIGGKEEIHFHAQKDMTSLIKNDETVDIRNDAHRTVAKNEFKHVKGESNNTTDGDLNIEAKSLFSFIGGGDHQSKIAGSQSTEVGNRVHTKSGNDIVLEAGASITLKCGASFIKLSSSGIETSAIAIGSGSPGSGAGSAVQLPNLPNPLKLSSIANVIAPQEAPVVREVPEVIPKVKVSLSAIPSDTSYAEEPYSLYRDGALIEEGETDIAGNIMIEHTPGSLLYKVELLDGSEFEIDVLEALSENISERHSRRTTIGCRRLSLRTLGK